MTDETREELEASRNRMAARLIIIGADYKKLRNETDALRKENAELKAQNLLIRGDNADLLANADAYSFNVSNMHAKILQLLEENEELRKVLAYITSFISIEDVGDDVACPGMVISSERFEEHATINGVLGFDKCEHPFKQPPIDVLKRAALANESEPSHE